MSAQAERAAVDRTQNVRLRGRILPREQGAASLDLVIGLMAFLAALALGGVLITEKSAQSWQSGLVGRLTVQILPDGEAPPEAEVNAAIAALKAAPGIISAAPLSDQDNLALVEPWLGRDAVVAALPFPRLIDVRLAPGASADLTALRNELKRVAPHSVLDDHGRWIARLKSVANTVVLGALAILVLIGIGTAATVAFATRAGLAAHRDIVQLLHLMGAQDGFIARAFEWHYFSAAAIASACGTLLAGVAFLAAGSLDEFGIASVSFLPPLGLPLRDLPWLALVPISAALIAWVTTRISVIAALHEHY
jgi:cell division transport system permease protein